MGARSEAPKSSKINLEYKWGSVKGPIGFEVSGLGFLSRFFEV